MFLIEVKLDADSEFEIKKMDVNGGQDLKIEKTVKKLGKNVYFVINIF